jgi:hypothetical protein
MRAILDATPDLKCKGIKLLNNVTFEVELQKMMNILEYNTSEVWTRNDSEQPLILLKGQVREYDYRVTKETYITTSSDKTKVTQIDFTETEMTTKNVNIGTIDKPNYQPVEYVTYKARVVCK